MNIEEITKKYLPMVQTLQRTAAEHGLRMMVTVSRSYIDAFITNNDDTDVYGRGYFIAGMDEAYNDEQFIKVSAFLASQCITTVTGIDCPIIPN